ncbi:MAG: hypothetical protein ACI4KB_09445 [Oscillospiraceae bacterium]
MDNTHSYIQEDSNQKSNGCLKCCLFTFVTLIGLIIVGILGIEIVDHIPYNIASQENGIYTVELKATSSPDWPFGSQDGRIVLKKNKIKKCSINFELQNDGKGMDENNWKVEWKTDKVIVTITGEEQTDEIFFLYYNGETENATSDSSQ